MVKVFLSYIDSNNKYNSENVFQEPNISQMILVDKYQISIFWKISIFSLISWSKLFELFLILLSIGKIIHNQESKFIKMLLFLKAYTITTSHSMCKHQHSFKLITIAR